MEQEVVEFCKSYVIVNREAFCDPRLELIINDARSLSLLTSFSYPSSFYHCFCYFNNILWILVVSCRAELESREDGYDVIIGDLADPIEGGPCYKLYTKSFYEFTIKPRLNEGGIFVTQVCVLMPPFVCEHSHLAQ
jgi:thermospermine synthase